MIFVETLCRKGVTNSVRSVVLRMSTMTRVLMVLVGEVYSQCDVGWNRIFDEIDSPVRVVSREIQHPIRHVSRRIPLLTALRVINSL